MYYSPSWLSHKQLLNRFFIYFSWRARVCCPLFGLIFLHYCDVYEKRLRYEVLTETRMTMPSPTGPIVKGTYARKKRKKCFISAPLLNVVFARLEMWTNHRADLHALEGSTTIYAWWFKLSTDIVAGDGFFHIFQVGKNYVNVSKMAATIHSFSQDGVLSLLPASRGPT